MPKPPKTKLTKKERWALKPGERLVRCRDCMHQFPTCKEPGDVRCQCGSTSIIEFVEAGEASSAASGKGKPPEHEIPVTSQPFYPSLSQLVVIQKAKDRGMAKSIDEFMSKAINTYALENMGGNNMEEKSEKIDLQEMLDKESQRELVTAQAETIRAKAKKIIEDTAKTPEEKSAAFAEFDDIMKMATQMPIIKMKMKMAKDLANAFTGEDGDSRKQDPEMAAMKQELAALKAKEQFDPILRSIDDLRKKQEDNIGQLNRRQEELGKLILEAQSKKAGETNEGTIERMAKIFADRDKEMATLRSASEQNLATLRAEVERAKNESMQQHLTSKIERLEEKMSGGGRQGLTAEIATIKEGIGALKDVAKEFAPAKAEKSGMEMAQELIGSTIDKIQEPVLMPLGQALADKVRGQQVAAQEQAAQAPAPQIEINPTLQSQEAPQTPSQEEDYSDLVQISSG